MTPKGSKPVDVLLELLDRVQPAETLDRLLEAQNVLKLYLLYVGDADEMRDQVSKGKLPGEFLLEILDKEPDVHTLLSQIDSDTRISPINRGNIRPFLELFSRRGIVFLALMLAVGPIVTFGLDSRIGMLFVGGIFALNGVGHFLVADKESFGRRLQKGIGIFLILFGFLTIVTMIVMLISGEQLSPPSS